MINREMKPVSVVSFTAGKDAYGLTRKNGISKRTVDMLIKVYRQTNKSDIRYVDVELIGLTADKDITDANQIESEGNVYQILYVIPSRRYNQVLMKRV